MLRYVNETAVPFPPWQHRVHCGGGKSVVGSVWADPNYGQTTSKYFPITVNALPPPPLALQGNSS